MRPDPGAGRLSLPLLNALSPEDRETYDEARIAHHARLVVVAIPAVDQIVKTGRRLVTLKAGHT